MTVLMGVLLIIGVGLGTLGVFNPDLMNPKKVFAEDSKQTRRKDVGDKPTPLGKSPKVNTPRSAVLSDG